MSPELEKRIAALAADRESPASALLGAAIAILRHGQRDGNVGEAAAAICAAQPSMAPMWNAAHAALQDDLERFAQRVARAPQAIARFALDTLALGVATGTPVRLVTLSYSGTVAHVLAVIARSRPLQVACSESRPALEGRRLAAHLASLGVPVIVFADAALGHALESCDAVVVGADAVSPEWVLNKSGTRMLAADASRRGVPLFVAAGREKFVGASTAQRLGVVDAGGASVWADAPAGVNVRNPLFERTPLDLIAGVISDIGVLGADAVAEVCASVSS
jgi:translation initiation factor 2B subunit (eIF-2B alpha/beta/delta family)